jgi:hypothetical protein
MINRKFGKFTTEEVRDKIDTLPKWAQEYIKSQDDRIEKLKVHVKDVNTRHPISNVAWFSSGRDNVHWIPNQSEISFFMDTPEYEGIRAHVDVDIRNDGDRQILCICGSKSISVEPRSGNLVYVYLESNEIERDRHRRKIANG